jgi:hypothetical protein
MEGLYKEASKHWYLWRLPPRDVAEALEVEEMINKIRVSRAPLAYKKNFAQIVYSTKNFTDYALKSLEKRKFKEFVESVMKLGADEREAFDNLFRSGFRRSVHDLWRNYMDFLEKKKGVIVSRLEKALGD